MTAPRGHLRLVSVGGKVVGDMRVFVSRKGDGLAFDIGIARDFELDFVEIAARSKPELFPILEHMLAQGCPPGAVDAGAIRDVKDLGSPLYSFVMGPDGIVFRWWKEHRWWSWEDERAAEQEEEEERRSWAYRELRVPHGPRS